MKNPEPFLAFRPVLIVNLMAETLDAVPGVTPPLSGLSSAPDGQPIEDPFPWLVARSGDGHGLPYESQIVNGVPRECCADGSQGASSNLALIGEYKITKPRVNRQGHPRG